MIALVKGFEPELFVIVVILPARVPAQLLAQTDGNPRQRRLVAQREGLHRSKDQCRMIGGAGRRHRSYDTDLCSGADLPVELPIAAGAGFHPSAREVALERGLAVLQLSRRVRARILLPGLSCEHRLYQCDVGVLAFRRRVSRPLMVVLSPPA